MCCISPTQHAGQTCPEFPMRAGATHPRLSDALEGGWAPSLGWEPPRTLEVGCGLWGRHSPECLHHHPLLQVCHWSSRGILPGSVKQFKVKFKFMCKRIISIHGTPSVLVHLFSPFALERPLLLGEPGFRGSPNAPLSSLRLGSVPGDPENLPQGA